jgi:hypothetical protein
MNRSLGPLVVWLIPIAALWSTILGWSTPADAYPLDGYENTGIGRLEAQRLIQIGEMPGKKRPSGELLPLARVELRLLDHRDMELPASDPALTARMKKLIGSSADRYGMALLDLSDLENPRYAEWNGHQLQNPGSVGKLMVALAIFQALADIYPDDIAARENVLRTSMITADIFSVSDHHSVPFWNPETRTVSKRPIKQGDTATLWTYLDWMMSPSSNSAAAMIEKNLVSITHFGKRYPVSPEEEQKFYSETPKKQLSEIFLKAIQDPITRNGLNLEELRQGSFFTHQGKKQIPGTNSYATPRELANFMLKLEQGRLVDEWSSREIKRLMYITERRHPLRIVRRVAAVRGLLQIRLTLQLRARSGLRVQEIPRQQAQLHELRRDHRDSRRAKPPLLRRRRALECVAEELRSGPPRSRSGSPQHAAGRPPPEGNRARRARSRDQLRDRLHRLRRRAPGNGTQIGNPGGTARAGLRDR